MLPKQMDLRFILGNDLLEDETIMYELGKNIKPKRVEWVDIAKGYGILLVIIGHLPIPWIISRSLYSFHLPLFFFLSGYFFFKKKNRF